MTAIVRIHLLILMILSIESFGQNANELQAKYKNSDAAISNSIINYEFLTGSNELVQIVQKTEETLLSLRYNQKVPQFIWYDNNSSVEKFVATSNLKQVLTDKDKLCENYTSEGFFYDDRKFCAQFLKFKEVGEIWKINSIKRVTDAKYLPSVFFQDAFPVLNKTVSFKIPKHIEVELLEYNFEGFNISKKEETVGTFKTITYTISNLAPNENMPFKPGIQLFSPHVLLLVKSCTINGKKITILNTVADLYGWYQQLIGQLKTKNEVFNPTVEKLIAGKKTNKEKIEAIYYWVQDNIRYIAYEDGIAGYKPDEAQNVFEKKYGDCKGMANLTKEMLKIAGFDSRLTWVGTNTIPYNYSIPSLAVDNHMICTVILDGKRYFLDATENYCAFGDYAERIQNRPVLIEQGENYILDTVPGFDKNRDLEKRAFDVKINGEVLEGSGKYILNGERKKSFHYAYNNVKSEKRDEYMDNYIKGSKSGYEISELNFNNLEDRTSALGINFKYVLSNSVSIFNNEMYVDIDPFKTFMNSKAEKDRNVDMDFGEKIYTIVSINLEIPTGYSVAEIPENFSVKEKDFSFSMTYLKNGKSIVYSKEISIDKGKIKKDDFEKWNSAILKLKKAYESQIVLKKI